MKLSPKDTLGLLLVATALGALYFRIGTDGDRSNPAPRFETTPQAADDLREQAQFGHDFVKIHESDTSNAGRLVRESADENASFGTAGSDARADLILLDPLGDPSRPRRPAARPPSSRSPF